MKTVGKRYHLALGTVAAAIVFVVGIHLPQTHRFKRLQEKVTALRTELEERSVLLQTTLTTYGDVRRMERQLASFDEAVPVSNRIGQFLENLDRIAHQCGLSDKKVVPAEVLENKEVRCLPIEIDFGGDFAAVYEFLRRVESLPRVARVQRMELARAEEAPYELVSSVTMHVYFRSS